MQRATTTFAEALGDGFRRELLWEKTKVETGRARRQKAERQTGRILQNVVVARRRQGVILLQGALWNSNSV